jgi:hypothetical protein
MTGAMTVGNGLDKTAQFALGQRYESGDGVPVDLKMARRLYQAAATPSGGTTYVYSPPVGAESTGRTLALNAGPAEPGLPEARNALERINAKLESSRTP